MPRMLDLFCGRLGWSKAFLARGWECVGVDLAEPPEMPQGYRFIKQDVAAIWSAHGWVHMDNEYACLWSETYDFICASPPCEQFSVHGMKCFFPSPPYPDLGIKLFNYTRQICEESGIPYVIENVGPAEKFVGRAQNRVGPFFLWGNGVPPILPQGIRKAMRAASGRWMREQMALGKTAKEARNEWQREYTIKAGGRKHCAAIAATIPTELANCVADYAERLLEQRDANVELLSV
jgi:hypothetical protein